MAVHRGYDHAWYATFAESSRASARAVVPLLLDWSGADSVVDVGCGEGMWLSVFAESGIDDLLGIDGHHVDPRALRIDPGRFRAHDLAQPFDCERRFGLATCFEVAEHLPAAAAEGFVKSLAALAPVVAFSAAIPHQGGTGHVNEQWPTYWAERFARFGMRVVDCLRPRIWNDASVTWWYKQNLLLFADDAFLGSHPVLAEARARTNEAQLSLVHPDAYLEVAAARRSGSGQRVLRELRAWTRPLRRALGR